MTPITAAQSVAVLRGDFMATHIFYAPILHVC